ncbi:MAG: hypothetical protein ABSH22_15970, partial [Tepidisphaeraceae bacterium]
TPKTALAALPAPQRAALELLLNGKSIAETARTAGVCRATLYNWLRTDPVFQAAYNQWHDELEKSCRSRLMTLTDKAADAVAHAVEGGDAKVAMQLLKGMGLLSPAPARLTDPDELRQQADLDRKRRHSERETASIELDSSRDAARLSQKMFADSLK